MRTPRRELLRYFGAGTATAAFNAACATIPVAAAPKTAPKTPQPTPTTTAPQPRPARLKRFKIEANHVDLFVRDTASSLPAMLCLHGMEGRGETWTGLISRYQNRFRILAPDQRGHGLSGRPIARYAPEDMAEDMRRLLEALQAAPAVVVGHSMGANVVSFLAAKSPQVVRAIVLVDPPPIDGPEQPSTLPPDKCPDQDPMTKDWPLPYASREEALRDLGERFPGPAYPLFFAESLVETVAGYDFLWSGRAMAAISEYRQGTRHLLAQIRCPVLLLRAGNSRVCTVEQAAEMRKLLPRCTFVEIPGAGHMVYLEHTEAFYKALDDWLATLH